MYDVVIIGGGPAGLTAALYLGRARRQVLVIDGNSPRNAVSDHSHGLLSRDGINPMELRQIGREQLLEYPSVEVREAYVSDVAPMDTGFAVRLADQTTYQARKLLLATGMRDHLQPIEGLAQLWGKKAYTCPYCHGWEVRDQPLAIYAHGKGILHYALMVSNWSADLVLCTDGIAELDDTERQLLQTRSITLNEEKITRFEDNTTKDSFTIHFESGQVLERTGLFIRPPQSQPNEFATSLGYELNAENYITTDDFRRTSTPGVYAAGDCTTPMQAIVMGASAGAIAATMLNLELLQDEVKHPLMPPRN